MPSCGDEEKLFCDLLDRARKGEDEAISMLYEHFFDAIYAYIAFRIPNRATAEDLTSDVFLKMMEGIHKVRADNKARFLAWLFQIAKNTIADYHRRCRKEPVCMSLQSDEQEYDAECSDPSVDPDQCLERSEHWRAFVRAFHSLTEHERQIIISKVFFEHDMKTIAKIIGKKPGAVKTASCRALKKLKKFLSEEN